MMKRVRLKKTLTPEQAERVLLDIGYKWVEAYENMTAPHPRPSASVAIERYQKIDAKRRDLQKQYSWWYKKAEEENAALARAAEARRLEISKKPRKLVLRKKGSGKQTERSSGTKLGERMGREGRKRLHLRKKR